MCCIDVTFFAGCARKQRCDDGATREVVMETCNTLALVALFGLSSITLFAFHHVYLCAVWSFLPQLKLGLFICLFFHLICFSLKRIILSSRGRVLQLYAVILYQEFEPR